MKNRSFYRSPTIIVMRIFAMLAGLLWSGALALWADTHYVSLDGGNVSPYTNGWASAATQIQWAVDQAVASDTVLVSNGTYHLTNQINILTNVTVRSLNGANFTFVNGNNYASKPVTNRCFFMRTGVLDGFTVTNGSMVSNVTGEGGGGICILNPGGSVYNCFISGNYVSNNSSYSGGGGIFIDASGVVISNCTVISNTVAVAVTGGTARRSGGGIYVVAYAVAGSSRIVASRISGNTAYDGGGIYDTYYASTPNTFSNCTIDGNRAINFGGGIVLGRVNSIVVNCVISNNVSAVGGGMLLSSGPRLLSSTIIGNLATNNGGGVYMLGYGATAISNCQVIANTASNAGGGIYFDAQYSAPNPILIADSVIAGNVAGNNGAGLYSIVSGASYPLIPTNSAIVRNCLVYGNTNLTAVGGGVYLANTGGEAGSERGPYVLINCTIAGNQSGTLGAGVWAGATNSFTDGMINNCIIYSNTTTNDVYDEIYNNAAINTNNYFNSCVRPTPGAANTTLAPNQGNITNDPAFADQASSNYRLSAGSPCVNAGTNQSWMTNAYDLDRRTRIRYVTVDMGAYEIIYGGAIFGFR